MNQVMRALERISLNDDDFVPYISRLFRRIDNPRHRSLSSLSDDSCMEEQSKFEKQAVKSKTFRTKVYKKRKFKRGLI